MENKGKLFNELGYIVFVAIWIGLLLVSTIDPKVGEIVHDFLRAIIQNSQHHNSMVFPSNFGL